MDARHQVGAMTSRCSRALSGAQGAAMNDTMRILRILDGECLFQ